MRAARLAQESAVTQLHGIAKPHFRYPPLELNAWYLPQVWRWDPLESAPPGASRAQRRLVGRPIIPALVEWMIPPEIWIVGEAQSNFNLHLRQRTGDWWEVDWTHLPENRVIAERLPQEIEIENPALGTTTYLRLPAPSRPRVSLIRSIGRGLFLDGWRRDETDRHRPENASTSLDLRRVRDSIYEQD